MKRPSNSGECVAAAGFPVPMGMLLLTWREFEHGLRYRFGRGRIRGRDLVYDFGPLVKLRRPVSADGGFFFACCGLIFGRASPVVPDIAHDDLDDARDWNGK
jgi:hypothetical protein